MSNEIKTTRLFRLPNFWAFLCSTFIVLYFIVTLLNLRPFLLIGCFPCAVSDVINYTSNFNSIYRGEKYIRTSEINAIRPYGFDGKCHKDEYALLKGKKLSYFPQNIGVYVEGTQNKLYESVHTQPNNADMKIDENNQSLFVEGTYIAIDKNKIVQKIFCVESSGAIDGE